MSLIIYSVILIVSVLLLIVYCSIKSENLIVSNANSSENGLDMLRPRLNFSLCCLFNNNTMREKKATSQELETQNEMEKQRKQLKRNLRTLNYISLLLANDHMVKNPKRLEEICNLKEGIERQIIKNTSTLNKNRKQQFTPH